MIRKGGGIMKQQTISDYEYSLRKKKTRREVFLDTMEGLIPWEEWVEAIRPHYPKGDRGTAQAHARPHRHSRRPCRRISSAQSSPPP